MPRPRVLFLYGVLVIGVVLLATIVSVPASLVAGWVANASGGAVKISRVSGSLWEGRGEVTLALGGPPITLPQVDWTVRPWRLALGEIAADVRVGGSDVVGKTQVARSFGGLYLRGTEATVPARLIAERFAWLRAWEAGGNIELKGDDVELLERGIVGEARVVWRGASAARVAKLGDYQLTLDGDRRETRFKLATLEGSLRLTGAGAIDAGGAIRVQGTAITNAEDRARLAPILSLFGPPRADGTVAFEWPLGGAAPARSPAMPGKAGAAAGRVGAPHATLAGVQAVRRTTYGG